MDSKKNKSSKFKKIVPSILGISTIVASSSIVFGITIGLSGKVNYLDIKPYDDLSQNEIFLMLVNQQQKIKKLQLLKNVKLLILIHLSVMFPQLMHMQKKLLMDQLI